MSDSNDIQNRLTDLVGDDEAFELLNTPNADLDGATPQDLIDSGNFAPIKIMLESMELREKARLQWLKSSNPKPSTISTSDEFQRVGEQRSFYTYDSASKAKQDKELLAIEGLVTADQLRGKESVSYV
jgi:hypothetical protein